jgi:DNA-binding CsgD family transcriptional regulator
LKAVPTLTPSDAERLLRFVAEAESVGGDAPFTRELLTELGKVIKADWVAYTEVDHVRRRFIDYVPRPGDGDEDDDDDGTELGADEWELMKDHPVCRRWRADGRFRALRLSDVLTRRELHDNRFYDVALRPWGVEHELKARLPSPPWHSKTFMFARRPGSDFAERDRLVLDLLVPHFTRLWQSAKTRRLLAAALDELEQAPEAKTSGVILLGPGSHIEFASAPARRLLRTYFPAATGGRLPSAVVGWLESGAGEPLCRRMDGKWLAVERSGDKLLLYEERVEPELTAREREVLAWVARGKTNAEIARLLWLAPSTVRKHLENVYAKLGVSTRTAAVARFLGLLDSEAS